VTHQLEVGQSTLNSFQTSNPRNDFGQYLLGLLTNPNKFISLWIKNLTSISPVYRIFSSLNIIFILAILTLTTFGVRTWIYPKYPNRVDGENQMSSSREIAPLKIKRQTITPQSVNEIVSKNLFRKERIEYQPPNSPQPTSQAAKVAPKPELPAPELTLRGVMLLGGTKIAILKGSHPVTIEGKVENTPIKRKGYHLGDKIGGYKISKISKREVILDNSAGQIIAVKLKRSVNSTDKIAKPKRSIDEISKAKQRKSTITSTRPVTKKRPQPTPRISGSHLTPLPKTPLSKHISGR
jgi:hypothetical protein